MRPAPGASRTARRTHSLVCPVCTCVFPRSACSVEEFYVHVNSCMDETVVSEPSSKRPRSPVEEDPAEAVLHPPPAKRAPPPSPEPARGASILTNTIPSILFPPSREIAWKTSESAQLCHGPSRLPCTTQKAPSHAPLTDPLKYKHLGCVVDRGNDLRLLDAAFTDLPPCKEHPVDFSALPWGTQRGRLRVSGSDDSSIYGEADIAPSNGHLGFQTCPLAIRTIGYLGAPCSSSIAALQTAVIPDDDMGPGSPVVGGDFDSATTPTETAQRSVVARSVGPVMELQTRLKVRRVLNTVCDDSNGVEDSTKVPLEPEKRPGEAMLIGWAPRSPSEEMERGLRRPFVRSSDAEGGSVFPHLRLLRVGLGGRGSQGPAHDMVGLISGGVVGWCVGNPKWARDSLNSAPHRAACQYVPSLSVERSTDTPPWDATAGTLLGFRSGPTGSFWPHTVFAPLAPNGLKPLGPPAVTVLVRGARSVPVPPRGAWPHSTLQELAETTKADSRRCPFVEPLPFCHAHVCSIATALARHALGGPD
jgi:hypothetical protein